MLILDEGQTIAIGDASYADASRSLTLGQWMALLVLAAFSIPLAVIAWIDVAALSDPVAVFQMLISSGLILLALVLVRNLCVMITGSGDLVVAIFDRSHAVLDVISVDTFGLTRKAIPFSEVHAIRTSRGEWNGESVAEVAVVELNSGQSIVLPESLSPREITMLRTLTGLRRR